MNSTAEAVVSYSTPLTQTHGGWILPQPPVAGRDLGERRTASRPRHERLCRAINIAAAMVGLVLTLPLMLLIAVAVKLTSPGPVLYTQKRVGIDRRQRRMDPGLAERRSADRGGNLFTILKFRTMTHRPECSDEVWATMADPRVTPLGRLLRKYRLDELPQLWNVLRGEMNIVGPRPEQPKIFEELREQVSEYILRQRVLPGITGWAQVNQSYDQTLEDVKQKVRLDLEYIERRSAAEDLRIMAMTVPVIVMKRGSL